MSSVVFIAPGEKNSSYLNGETVINVGGDSSELNLEVKDVGYQNTFIIKNPDDESVELYTIMKRPTFDLVLPDNRMGAITIVSNYKKIDRIPIQDFGGSIIVNTDATVEEKVSGVIDILKSFESGNTVQYVIFNETFEKIREGSLEIPKNMFRSILKKITGDETQMSAQTMINLVRRNETDITNIKNAYFTNALISDITSEWLQGSISKNVEITTGKEEQIKGLFQKNKKEDSSESSETNEVTENTQKNDVNEITENTQKNDIDSIRL